MAPATRKEVCTGNEAVSIATAWASALKPETDGTALASELRAAQKAAPNAIQADFKVLVDAQLPFLDLLARTKASGNYAGLASDPEFSFAVGRLSQPNVAVAISRINRWFASHCTEAS